MSFDNKRHLEYERERLKGFNIDITNLSDEHIEQAAKVLKAVQDPHSRRQTLFNLQPRWTARTNDENELYDEAVSLVARTGIADTTFIRDQLSIGNSMAETIIQRLEDEGLVSRLPRC
jgi:DNA segregation ATPase FtsK/SpoIIIE-like protein